MNTTRTEATMGSYAVTMQSGDFWEMRADFSNAACPITHVDAEGDEHPTPYQVADAQHSPERAAEMLVAYWARQSGDDGDAIECVVAR